MPDLLPYLANPESIIHYAVADPYLLNISRYINTTGSSEGAHFEKIEVKTFNSAVPTKVYFPTEEQENRLTDQVGSLEQLEDNWDTEGAEAPNHKVLSNTKVVLEMLFHLNLAPDDIVPSAEGGIGIVFKHGELYADIELFNDEDIVITMSNKDGNPSVSKVENITHQDIEQVRRFLDST